VNYHADSIWMCLTCIRRIHVTMESNLEQLLRFLIKHQETRISTQTMGFTNFSALVVTRHMRDKQEDLCIKDIMNILGTQNWKFYIKFC